MSFRSNSLVECIRDLTPRSAGAGADDQAARDAVADAVRQALSEIDRIAEATTHRSERPLGGATPFSGTLQSGACGGATNIQLNVSLASQSLRVCGAVSSANLLIQNAARPGLGGGRVGSTAR